MLAWIGIEVKTTLLHVKIAGLPLGRCKPKDGQMFMWICSTLKGNLRILKRPTIRQHCVALSKNPNEQKQRAEETVLHNERSGS
jgi:hypothetical protein